MPEDSGKLKGRPSFDPTNSRSAWVVSFPKLIMYHWLQSVMWNRDLREVNAWRGRLWKKGIGRLTSWFVMVWVF